MRTRRSPWKPTDKQIIDWVREHYSQAMAEQVQAAIKSKDGFGKHVRKSFVREMLEAD